MRKVPKENSGYPTSAQVLEMYDAYEKEGAIGIARVLAKRQEERRTYLATQGNSPSSAKPANQNGLDGKTMTPAPSA
jgi:hypothetical protein